MTDPDQVLDIKERIGRAMFSGMSMSLRDDLCETLDELWLELASQEEDIHALRAALDRAEAEKAAIPQQGDWFRAVEPLIRRCEVAVAVKGDAVWNSIGAQAHAELLKEMARILDTHRCAAQADTMAQFDARMMAQQIADSDAALMQLCTSHGMPADGLPMQWLDGRLRELARAEADKAQWQPMPATNDIDVLILRSTGAIEYIAADDNDYTWRDAGHYEASVKRGIDCPVSWMPAASIRGGKA
jgi:hypothetical protein